jgi:hypothetical protein
VITPVLMVIFEELHLEDFLQGMNELPEHWL